MQIPALLVCCKFSPMPTPCRRKNTPGAGQAADQLVVQLMLWLPTAVIGP